MTWGEHGKIFGAIVVMVLIGIVMWAAFIGALK